MDSVYFTDAYRKPLVPVWTPFGSTFFCSIGARTSPVAPRILKYREPVSFLLAPTASAQLLADLDYTKFAVWYNSREHWKAYIPNSSPRESPFGELEEDPVGICYGESCIGMTEETREVYTNNDDVDQPEIWSEGSFLSVDWVDEIFLIGRRLHSICQTLATTSDFYHNGDGVGEYPEPLDQDHLRGVHEHSQAAQTVAQAAVRGVLSMLGFVAWFLTIVELHHTQLSDEVKDYITNLRLNERPKIGAVYDLGRDINELNFGHLINNDVPFHYIWSDKEREDPRFIQFSPECYHEVANLLTAAKGGEIRVQDLPSYDSWKADLEGTDWPGLGRNLRVGKRGFAGLVFSPDWEYEIVDDHGFGARPLYHWHMIRAYAERFKAVTHVGYLTTVCTFFRRNPIGIDEPPFVRPIPIHRFALTDFARHADGEARQEADYYYESSERVREQVKTMYAPRPGRRFSSFDGRRADDVLEPRMDTGTYTTATSAGIPLSSAPENEGGIGGASSLLDRLGPNTSGAPSRPTSERDEGAQRETEIISHSCWVNQMVATRARSGPSGTSRPTKNETHPRPASRTSSLISGSSRASVEEEFYDAASPDSVEDDPSEIRAVHGIQVTEGYESRETPFPTAPSPVDLWISDFQTLDHALDAVSRLAPSIMEVKPRQAPYGDLDWDYMWLQHAYLVCSKAG